ncbi:MAG: inorganic phosphate transporter [Anaerolineae bacterium]
MPAQYLFIIFAATCLLYAFLNGYNDASSLMGAAILSRSIEFRTARLIASVAEFAGPFLFGLAVAHSIGHDLLDTSVVSPTVVFSTVIAAVAWIILMSYLGLPSSSSHALVGGLVGATVISSGWNALHTQGLVKILLSLFLAPFVGLIAGYLLLKLVLFLSSEAHPRVNNLFKRLQLLTIVGLSLSHGSNDGQKSIGLIALGLTTFGLAKDFSAPPWAIIATACAISLGVFFGRRRTIRTVGGGIYRLQPVDAFAAEFASAFVVLTAAILGGPASTAQVMTSSIMGVGAAERVRGVRWEAGQRIAWAWFMTIPAVAVLAALVDRFVFHI